MVGVYKITNKINGKSYIGQSVDIKRRWAEHKARAFDPNNNCYDKPLYNSFRKHGIENFEFTVLEECSVDQINDLETFYIQQYNALVPNGYNLEAGAPDSKYYCSIALCKNCGITMSKYTQNNLCRSCYSKSTRLVERPNRDELKNLIRSTSFVALARKYGVSDKAITKWCIAENLPCRKSEIKAYSDKEWELI